MTVFVASIAIALLGFNAFCLHQARLSRFKHWRIRWVGRWPWPWKVFPYQSRPISRRDRDVIRTIAEALIDPEYREFIRRDRRPPLWSVPQRGRT